MLYCNWLSSKELCELWNKMSKGEYTWNNIKIVYDLPADYFVIINSPQNTNQQFIFEKTIIFQMEPHMDLNKGLWNEWSEPSKFGKYIFNHKTNINNLEWHLSKTYTELKNEPIIKTKILSTILSNKYTDPGHIKRIDFVKYLEVQNFSIDVFGQNTFNWKNYNGSLPYHKKDNGLLPYKYTFNVENYSIENYITEKLIDGILAECLVFYHGSPNVCDYFDKDSFIILNLNDFDESLTIIKNAIDNNLWEEKLPKIRKMKEKILDHMQFFPRLETIMSCIK
jgi:hypothetical protein